MLLPPTTRLTLNPVIDKPIPQVAIVIAGRNSEKYLAETIESALTQSISCEIVYADDASTDASVSIACRYISQGVTVIPHGVHSGVCSTRNRGALATKAPWIIFLDTDDKLNNNYARDMLQDANRYTKQSTPTHPSERSIPTTQPRSSVSSSECVPFVYPSTMCFGDATTFWKNLEWSKYDKWRQNQVSTTSMWNRSVFIAAGMWQDFPTMWDYSLALRCSRFGTPVAGNTILDYRIHDASQSVILNERLKTEAIQYQELIRRKEATLGIGSLVSGRIPELFPRWLDHVARSVRYLQDFDGQKRNVRLLLLLHTQAQSQLDFYIKESARYADTLSVEFQFINDRVDRSTDYQRRQTVCRLLAKGCQQIQDTLGTDIVWLIEDDIIVPLDACYLLHHALTEGNNPPIGATGTYYNRHPGLENQVLGGWIQHGKHVEPKSPFRPQDVVDFVGTGCLMYWPYRPDSPKQWRPISRIENATAHDWAWSEDVKGTLIAVGKVMCDHHTSLTEKV